MADGESDLGIEALEIDLDALFDRYCKNEPTLLSKEYCSDFCKLVEDHTRQWQVPLPQLKLLRIALCRFTKATSTFPEDCQHIGYALSSLALSFFELMLFFSKEEFQEHPLKDILDSLQDCHSKLLRHKNVYLQQVRQIINDGGPWEGPVLQAILWETAWPQTEVENYLSSEVPVFFELRVRYLQACERVQEALALAKSCLEHPATGRHLYFHQAYLTCLYKASLHEHLQKEVAEIDGRDAVEMICNTESIEKDELLLYLCKAFLTQQLQNGDMYYIWDLVFIWSRLHLRAHPSKQGFLAECRQLMASVSNVRAIFLFIKVVTEEMGTEGVQFCVELCARAMQRDPQSDPQTRSLVCKTLAFLLRGDLEVCRACALLVLHLEHSLEAYRTVWVLYTHPDQEQHPHQSPIKTNIRFLILQLLKEGLCFDPEFWNLFTLRTHCLELMSDKAVTAALSEMQEEEQAEEEWIPNDLSAPQACGPHPGAARPHPEAGPASDGSAGREEEEEEGEASSEPPPDSPVKRRWWSRRRRRRGRRRHGSDDADSGDDPEIKYAIKPTYTDSRSKYSLRRHPTAAQEGSLKQPANRQREYLARRVKNTILKRRGRKPRWLLEMIRLQAENIAPEGIREKGRGRGRWGKRNALRTSTLELSYPENEMTVEERVGTGNGIRPEGGLDPSEKENEMMDTENSIKRCKMEGHGEMVDVNCVQGNAPGALKTDTDSRSVEAGHCSPGGPSELELDGPLLTLEEDPLQLFHNYSKLHKEDDENELQPPESPRSEADDDSTEQKLPLEEDPQGDGMKPWKARALRARRYAHLQHHCVYCHKDFKGGNVVRHSIAHLKRRRVCCIFCGSCFKKYNLAKEHVLKHIDELLNNPPGEQKTDDTEPKSATSPAVNGSTAPPEGERQVRKPKPKSEISKQARIIQNLRVLLKKTRNLNKTPEQANHTGREPTGFKDEQVLVKDKRVILKTEMGKEGGEVKEREAGENGLGAEYPLCPAENCEKIFMRIGPSLLKHALRFHTGDPAVLEQTFLWSKGRCIFCQRHMLNVQHYIDHMKLHDAPLRQLCVHLKCSRRFKTPQELKEHMETHRPLQPQCLFPGCELIFTTLSGLHDHEWRHYTQPQGKEGPGQVNPSQVNPEAPWKHRVKILELWQQEGKGQREKAQVPDSVARHGTGTTERVPGQAPESNPNGEASNTATGLPRDPGLRPVNGHEVGHAHQAPEGERPASHATPTAPASKPKNFTEPSHPGAPDNVDVRDAEEPVTLPEVLRTLEDPVIQAHKPVKPEDPVCAPFVKAPFIRPPPSTYLDESALSMRKRSKASEASSSPQSSSKSRLVVVAVPQRQRCSKCLSSFSGPVELEKHQALNTCSSLFNFDSDDDS
ncbi:zinc finger protein 654-like [Osmerus mordax]|uniref:zinc finger protein 654-like n=1 Tax=Osmerus mordax TaxID=8014 RepID=UPI003510CECE